MSTDTLPFSLRIASGEGELKRACRVRSASYGKHLPNLRVAFAEPDEIDRAAGTRVLLCEDKLSGEAVGTARLQTSIDGALLIERCIDVPDDMRRHARAEITRLSALQGAHPLVKLALWKAAYLYCQAAQAKWMVIGARNAALARQYERLGFADLYGDKRMVPLSYAGGVPHRVMRFCVTTAERTWFAAGNALYAFMFETVHPDIDLFGRAAVPRRLEALPLAA